MHFPLCPRGCFQHNCVHIVEMLYSRLFKMYCAYTGGADASIYSDFRVYLHTRISLRNLLDYGGGCTMFLKVCFHESGPSCNDSCWTTSDLISHATACLGRRSCHVVFHVFCFFLHHLKSEVHCSCLPRMAIQRFLSVS